MVFQSRYRQSKDIFTMPHSKPCLNASVLAGDEGMQPFSLTAQRRKPSMPFIGKHHIFDFVFGNLLNSGANTVYVRAQRKALGLSEHVHRWNCATPNSAGTMSAVTVPQPEKREGRQGFNGTADTVAGPVANSRLSGETGKYGHHAGAARIRHGADGQLYFFRRCVAREVTTRSRHAAQRFRQTHLAGPAGLAPYAGV
ncbi:MAG: hypothetical protein H7274_14755 [Rhodoferax sp.]|nr:hypothetical protein [Rhodoferax sp.]